MNTLKMITGILFFLQCFTFTVLAESLPKFAMIISNCFSCGGAALSRHTFGETVQTVNWQFPHYFIAISRNTTAKKTRFLLICMN